MADDLKTLSTFIPAIAVRHAIANPERLKEPILERNRAGVLFLDISGFTKLAESLAELGPEGSEKLTHILNEWFGRLIQIVASYRGEVVSFAGDAFVAVWLRENEEVKPRDLVMRVTACAYDMQEIQPKLQEELGVSLNFKLGVGLGRYEMLHLSGVGGNWALLTRGPGVEEAIGSEAFAEPGDIIVAPEAWGKLDGAGKGKEADRRGHMLLQGLKEKPDKFPIKSLKIPDGLEPRLGAYCLPVIRSRISAGQSSYLAELRNVSVMFANLPGIKADTMLPTVHEVVSLAHDAIHQYEGSLNKLSVDDKGVSMLAVFGLPPVSHEDDAARACMAALKLQESLRTIGHDSSVGLSTGQAFCGAVGSDIRREYTVIGDVVNLSARLMQAANGGILCETGTYEEAVVAVQFRKLEPIMVKGKSNVIPIFEPFAAMSADDKEKQRADSRQVMIGRERELKKFILTLAALREDSQGSIQIIEGQPGCGKSLMLEQIRKRANAMGFVVAATEANALDTRTPYLVWKNIIWRLLRYRNESKDDAKVRMFEELEARDLDPVDFPVLNDVLSFGLRESRQTQALDADARANQLGRFLAVLLSNRVSDQGLVLIFDDCQWMDEQSWGLLATVAAEIPRMVLVLGLRNIPDEIPWTVHSLLEESVTTELGPLPHGEANQLMRTILDCEAVDPKASDLVYQRSGGNPYFIAELVRICLAEGQFVIRDQVCQVDESKSAALDLLPKNIQSLITSKVDRLPPREQLALKVASVVGIVFSLRIVSDVFPVNKERNRVPKLLDSLATKGILVRVSSRGNRTIFKFRQATVQEAAYDLLLFEQRRKLHRGIGRWYNEQKSKESNDYLSLMAYHWERAGDAARALRFLERAAMRAARAALHTEVVRLIEHSIETAERASQEDGADIPKRRFVRWHRLLADAYFGLGKLEQCERHSRLALEDFGVRAPNSSLGWTARTTLEDWRSTPWRARTAFSKDKRKKESAVVIDASLSADRLAECALRNRDEATAMGAMQLALNLANRLDPEAKLIPVYITAANLSAVRNKHRLANKYFSLARQLALGNRAYTHLIPLIHATTNYAIGRADWSAADSSIKLASKTMKTHGDREDRNDLLGAHGDLLYYQGFMLESEDMFDELAKRATRQRSLAMEIKALAGKSRTSISLGRFDKSEQDLNRAIQLLHDSPDHSLELLCRGLLGLVLMRQGKVKAAFDSVCRAFELSRATQLIGHNAVAGFTSMGEALVQLSVLSR
ncbi:MAG: BREX system ATP-binding domain-containing protein, partial [Myxococcota bacterium]|nr:BREX system ATP-binding domain-containing protein [Myxococcota bacterium]